MALRIVERTRPNPLGRLRRVTVYDVFDNGQFLLSFDTRTQARDFIAREKQRTGGR